jgi:two-component system NarL family response regulator
VEEQATRIIQEALQNIARHAQARLVDIDFQISADETRITLTDNGVGFEYPLPQAALLASAGQPAKQAHFGLQIMQERAEKVGGQLKIQTSPGEGTRLSLVLPRFISGSQDEDLKEMRGIRLVLADDHPLFLDGLRNLLVARGFTIVGTAADGKQAVEKVRALRPDVAVLDLNMPGYNGIEATRLIKAELPEVKVVILTAPESDDHLYEALRSGASGYLYKDLEANQFCQLLVDLLRGEAAFGPGIAERLMADLMERDRSQLAATEPQPSEASLSPRQWEILQKVAEGLTYKEIGASLHITEKTVKYHMGQIIERLNVENRAQAIAELYRRQQD